MNELNGKEKKVVLTAEDAEPELSPRCITRTLHLTLTFLCFTPNWVQMRTMVKDAAKSEKTGDWRGC